MPTPRPQTLWIFLLCIIAVGGTAAYVRPWKNASAPQPKIETVTATSTAGSQIVSSEDWKKTFFTVSGTSASTYQNSAATSGTSENVVEALTPTDIFSRDFFSKYMTLKQGGLSYNSPAADATIDEIANDSLLSTPQPTIYDRSNIHISADDSPAAKRQYGNAVAYILRTNAPEGNEAVIAKNAFEQDNESLLQAIDPIIAGYTAIRTQLLNLGVPASAAEYHVDLVNAVSEALSNAAAFRGSFKDPLSTVAAAATYQSTEIHFMTAMTNLRAYFVDEGIAFTAGESAFNLFTEK